ncbi:hypothetical protein PGB28_16280 [Primorskyibacter aestuariivivens]|uniref:hypothetical protein n=1 Tax=Primorskyibacter aestuariivivens TaxID=1888912 RepID=UPI0022FFD779|nr:hypothetical protein [Primorskyibacter aestuariivivens]MDA7430024.1 hypothetical protein [Primorskyibacter aestuariivivens]
MRRAGLMRVFQVSLLLTALIYGVMVAWSLPRIAVDTGGLRPFDLRPMGYDTAAARAFLDALSVEGRRFYLGTQHMLDAAYPPLLAVTLCLAAVLWLPRRLILAVAVAALVGMAADLLENRAVAAMLSAAPVEATAEQIARASRFTIVKSGATTLAMMLLLIGGVWRWRRG